MLFALLFLLPIQSKHCYISKKSRSNRYANWSANTYTNCNVSLPYRKPLVNFSPFFYVFFYACTSEVSLIDSHLKLQVNRVATCHAINLTCDIAPFIRG